MATFRWRESYFKMGDSEVAGIGKIASDSDKVKSDKFVATMAIIEKKLFGSGLKITASETFSSRNDAAAWMWEKGGYKSIRSNDHLRELGLLKYEKWFSE